MKKHASSYLILQKIITSLCMMKCRDTTGTKTSAPFILWWYIIRISKISWLTNQFAFFLTTWIMITVLFMNSKDWFAILFKKYYLESSILSIGSMVVQVNTRYSKILSICATMWITLGFMLSRHSLPQVMVSPLGIRGTVTSKIAQKFCRDL